VFFEEYGEVLNALEREKQIKGWIKQKKIDLILSTNSEWLDLADSLFA